MVTDQVKSHLVAVVDRHSRTVIDSEIRRLARRVPSLSPTALNVINAALEELADSAILVPLRNAPPDTAPLLARIFQADPNTDQRKAGMSRQ